MKKLFILLTIIFSSISLWAQNWEPKDVETFIQNYDKIVLNLPQEQQKQLSKAQYDIENELKKFKNIQLYSKGGWYDYYAVQRITEILKNIKDVYDLVEFDVRELLGAWMSLQYVTTGDTQTEDAQMGLLSNVFMIIANEHSNSDKQLAFDLNMMSTKIQMNYKSVLIR